MSDDGREDLRARIRSETPPPHASVVIRGGPDTLALLRTHARRLHRLYRLDGEPVFGVSVFVSHAEVGPGSERSILTTRLRTYPTVYRTTVRALTEAGLSLHPTLAAPHYTVVLPDLDAVDELARAFGGLLVNPYAEVRRAEQ